MRKSFLSLILVASTAFFAGCGGGGTTVNGTSSSSGSSGGSSTTTSTATAAVAMKLTDSSGNVTNSISSGSPGQLAATVTDATGQPVANALVTFTTDSNYGTFSPASGTALTNSSGTATVTLNVGSTTGAASVIATATFQQNGTDVTATGALNYQASTTATAAVSLSTPAFGVGSNHLSAYGTTSVSVNVTGSSSPLSVSFTSACAAAGKAVLTSSATTINGVATASYRDNGCAGPDLVTASILSGVSSSASLVVDPPSVGSIQFVSANPDSITLKGTGGAGLQQASTVQFKVLDTAGKPIAQTVNFGLSTTVGGITFGNSQTTASANSDSSTGLVQVVVDSGTVSTPVRVTATVAGTSISTQSDQLYVSTGIPDEAHFSLSASTFNVEGWRYDGVTSTITVRLADHFGNPVPDGTAVSFISDGALVQPACTTTNSSCKVTFTSQNLRPDNGRVDILAYAIGEESFTDLNGNGVVDNASEMVDTNGNSTDLPEAWLDSNENGAYDSNERFVDFNGNNVHDGPDGLYEGILCASGAPICASQKTLDVFGNIVLVLSDSYPITADIFRASTTNQPIATIDLGGNDPTCLNLNKVTNLNLVVRDKNGNPLPAGSTVSVSTTDGTIVLPSTSLSCPVVGKSQQCWVVPNSNASYTDTVSKRYDPASLAFNFPVSVQNDEVKGTTGCTDPTPNGQLTVTVTTPGVSGNKGTETTVSLPVTN